MPSATNSAMASSTTGTGAGAAKPTPGTEAGPATAAAPQAAAAGVNITTVQTEAMKQILGVIDKKLRNLEKKKSKLDDYQERMNKGERLNQDQLDAVSKYQEVTNNLEFAKELQRSFMALSQEIQKTIKKTARREQLMREEAEQKRLKTVLELQFILEKLGNDEVRSDLKQGSSGVPVLTEEELTMLDEFYKLVYPERDMNVRSWLDCNNNISNKALREVVERILQTSYFDSTHNHQNGLCEEEEAAPAPVVEDPVAEAEPDPAEEFTEPTEVESTEYVNRQFMAETQFSSSEKEQVDEWTVETVEDAVSKYQEVTNNLEFAKELQRSFMALSQEIQKTIKKTARREQLMREEAEQKRLKTVLELQFILEKLGNDEVRSDLKQGSSGVPVLTEEELTMLDEFYKLVYPERDMNVVNSLQQQTQATSPPVAEPHTLPTVAQADPLVRRQRVQDLMAQMQGPYNFMQDSMLEFENQTLDPAIVSAQPMNPAQSLDMPQMVCPPVHAESRLAQPTQVPVQSEATQASMSLNADQTPSSSSLPTASQPQVFQAGSSKPLHSSGINVNAAPFQSMQTVFNMNAPVPPVNEPEILKQQNQYQASYNQSFSNQPHQVEQSDLQQEQLQTGGYDGYRPSFSNTPNSGYTQPQFNAPRDYSNYQRDGYQQNFKRGSGQSGPRGAPRGRGGPPRPNRGMPQMSAQQVN
ncbi:hypothetical protein WISP_37181 [Willisornis vidua]|uniref:CAPR1 protein n=1 Tax=Willisornis vidua TaxID=1566151 RepID=A0ABQ9DML9_9PASS|nr:hypothetical protein WISP_37181 [Willisornis vidua]